MLIVAEFQHETKFPYSRSVVPHTFTTYLGYYFFTTPIQPQGFIQIKVNPGIIEQEMYSRR